jgi:hypothetical protein
MKQREHRRESAEADFRRPVVRTTSELSTGRDGKWGESALIPLTGAYCCRL